MTNSEIVKVLEQIKDNCTVSIDWDDGCGYIESYYRCVFCGKEDDEHDSDCLIYKIDKIIDVLVEKEDILYRQ